MGDAPARKLLMIPGPIEVSPEVRAAHDGPPPGHLAPDLVEAYGLALEQMREVWQAPTSAQPFLIAGSGTLAMDMAAANLVQAGMRALVVDTGYFSERMAEILRRYGADVASVKAEPGHAVTLDQVEVALRQEEPHCVFVTHVDTSTGVRMPAHEVAKLAQSMGAMTVVDGVCATAAEPLSMMDGAVDIYLTGSQKAIGVPRGLLCWWRASERWLLGTSYRYRRRTISTTPRGGRSCRPTRAGGRPTSPRQRPTSSRRPRWGLSRSSPTGFRGELGSRLEPCAMRTGGMRSRSLAGDGAYPFVSDPEGPGRDLERASLSRFGGAGPGWGDRSARRDRGRRTPSQAEVGVLSGGPHGLVYDPAALLERTIEAVGEGLRTCGTAVDVEAAKGAFREAFEV